PNCLGFTKMLTTVLPHRAALASHRLRCPSCRAPMVGTKPMLRPPSRKPATIALNSPTVVTTDGIPIALLTAVDDSPEIPHLETLANMIRPPEETRSAALRRSSTQPCVLFCSALRRLLQHLQ